MTQTPTLLVPRDVGSLHAAAPCFRATQLCANEPWSCSLRGAPGSSAVPLPQNFCVLVQRGGGGWGSCGSQVGSRRRPRARGRGTDRGSTGCGTAPPDPTPPHRSHPRAPLVLLTAALGKKRSSRQDQAHAGVASALAFHRPLPCQVPKPLLCRLVAWSSKPSQPWKALH